MQVCKFESLIIFGVQLFRVFWCEQTALFYIITLYRLAVVLPFLCMKAESSVIVDIA